MNIGINFKFLGKIDPQPLIESLNKIDELDKLGIVNENSIDIMR